MAASRALSLAFIVAFSSFPAQIESQNILVDPKMIAVKSYVDNAILNCSVTNIQTQATYVIWSHIRGTVDFIIFNSYYSNASVYDPANFAANFFITRDANNFPVQANAELTVLLAKPELASIYTCHLTPATEVQGTTSLIVLDAAECPSSTEYVEYIEGTVVNMSCSVNFYDKSVSPFVPNLEFIRADTEEVIPGGVISDEIGRRTLQLNKTLTAEDDDLEYICRVSYPTNGPTYSDNCSTIFYVLHSVSEVSFLPLSSIDNPIEVLVGETINATANGRPAPTFAWYDEQNTLIAEGDKLTIVADMQSWAQPVTVYCRANNTIDNGVTFTEVIGNYTFYVGEAAAAVQSAGVEPWVIAVAVIVPVVVLTAIAIAVFFIVRHRKQKKKTAKAKTTNGSSVQHTTTAANATIYSPVATGEPAYAAPNRPPPNSAARTNGSTSRPPGPDSRNGRVGGTDSPGFGDLGVRTYGGSNQAVNVYPPRSSVHGSNQAIAVAGVSMNPNPGYRSNPVLNASVTSNPRPQYPYTGSNSALNTSMSMNPNPAAVAGVGYGRQPSITSSSGRSHASSYNGAIPSMEVNRYQNDLSSMHGSEV